MRPNIDKRFKEFDEVLFRCECSGNHFMSITDYSDGKIQIDFIERPASLWSAIKAMLRYKEVYYGEAILNTKDVVAMRDALDKFIKKAL
ncbi:MAG: hypothetical protein HN402_07970 [Candidatus Scalindua sp.]|jgi:hypothetical protein|nr:hypothetical protein [Candidatus Scalindua sp.]MBT6757793.1 hypothetical protein [Candidatus Jacksonbacteria bacterium]